MALDPSQTLLSSSISTSGSTTTLLFRRKLNNGGAVPIAESASVNAVWALGLSPVLADHGPSAANRGSFVLPVTSAAMAPDAGTVATVSSSSAIQAPVTASAFQAPPSPPPPVSGGAVAAGSASPVCTP